MDEPFELVELTDAQTYATAALFTLALYRCQDVAFLSRTEESEPKNIWGIPSHIDLDTFDDDEASRLELDTAGWQQLWGWDLIAPNGLCHHVYQILGVPQSSWFGLLRIVLHCDHRDGRPRVSYDTVATFRALLQGGDTSAAVIQARGPAVSPPASQVAIPEQEGSQSALPPVASSVLPCMPSDSTRFQSDTGLDQSDAPSVPTSALLAVLQALVCRPHMPMLEQITPGASASGAAHQHFSYIDWPDRKGSFRLAPRVHWYDARGRVALKEMATWLRVPWHHISGYESSIAAAAWSPEPRAALAKKVTWQARGLRYLAVGTAAVTGGTLLAITGGLAAPVVAAGVGGVLTATGVGGMAAVGGALTSFVGSTAGAALVMTGLGAAGATHAGGKAAKRLGDVREFGFRELLDDTDLLMSDSCMPSLPSTANDVQGGQVAPSSSASLLDHSSRESTPKSTSQGNISGGEGDDGTGVGVGSRCGSAASWDLLGPMHGGDTGEPTGQATNTGGGMRQADPCGPPCPESDQQQANTAKPPLQRFTSGSWFPSFSYKSKSSMSEPAATDTGPAVPSDDSSSPSSYDQSGAASSSSTSKQPSGSWSFWQRVHKDAPLLPVPLTAQPHGAARLAVTLAIHGWISSPQDTLTLWNGLDGVDSQRFVLIWETKELIVLHNMIRSMITSKAGGYAAQWFIEHFMGAAVVAALSLPMAVMGVAGMLDGPWGIVMDRAQKAGVLLAHVLMSGCHGDRPVILIGYSMGARLLYYCLKEMNAYNALGIVEHAVLLGAPVGTDPVSWSGSRSVVSGRLVNGYSNSDWVLGLGYRSQSGFIRMAAGLAPIEVAGVENVNLSTIIKGHTDYISQMDTILAMLRLHG